MKKINYWIFAAMTMVAVSCSDDAPVDNAQTRTAEELANMRVVELMAEDMPCNSKKYLHRYGEYYILDEYQRSELRMDYGGQEFLLRMPDLSEVGLQLTAVTSWTYNPERVIEFKPEDTKFSMTFDNIKMERLNEREFIFSTTFNRTSESRSLYLKFEGPASEYQKRELGMEKTVFYIEVMQDENVWEVEADVMDGARPNSGLEMTAEGVDPIYITGFIGITKGWMLPAGEADIFVERSTQPELKLECVKVTEFLVTETDFNHSESKLNVLADYVENYIEERDADVKWIQASEAQSASSKRVSIYDQTENTFRMRLPANMKGHDRVFAMVCRYQPTLSDKRWFHYFTPYTDVTYFLQTAE